MNEKIKDLQFVKYCYCFNITYNKSLMCTSIFSSHSTVKNLKSFCKKRNIYQVTN